MRGIRRVLIAGSVVLTASAGILFQNCVETASISPIGPSNNQHPVISGKASSSGAEVRIYFNSQCNSEPVATTTVADDGNFSIQVTVDAGATTEIWADDDLVGEGDSRYCFYVGHYTHVTDAFPRAELLLDGYDSELPGTFGYISDIVPVASGNVYFTGSRTVWRLAPDGSPSLILDGTGANGITFWGEASTIAVDEHENVYVPTPLSNTIFRVPFDPAGSVATFHAGSVGSVQLDGDGGVYAASVPGKKLYRIAPDDTISDFSDVLSIHPILKAVDLQHRPYVTTGGVHRFDENGVPTWLTYYLARDLALAPNGNMLGVGGGPNQSDGGPSFFIEVTPEGESTLYPDETTTGDYLNTVAVDAEGHAFGLRQDGMLLQLGSDRVVREYLSPADLSAALGIDDLDGYWQLAVDRYGRIYIGAARRLIRVRPGCDDGVDNDGDGLVDFPDDPDCTSATSTMEHELEEGGNEEPPVESQLAEVALDAGDVTHDENWIPRLTASPSGNVYALIGRGVYRIAPQSAPELLYEATSEYPSLSKIAVDENENVIVLAAGDKVVLSIDPEGNAETVLDFAGESPIGMALTPGNVLYATAGYWPAYLYRLVPGQPVEVTEPQFLVGDVVADQGGNVYIMSPDAMGGGSALYRIPQGGEPEYMGFGLGMFPTLDPSGNVVIPGGRWYPLGSGAFVMRFDGSGEMDIVRDTSSSSFRAIAFDSLGNTFVARSTERGSIRRIRTDGTIHDYLSFDELEAEGIPMPVDTPMANVADKFFSATMDSMGNLYLGTHNLLIRVSPACSDGRDNDGDGLVDYPEDPDCPDASHTMENVL